MPNRDGTGPRGEGPQTGSKMGKCSGSKNVPFEHGKGERGCGRHRGTGERWKNLDNTCNHETKE